MNSTETWLRRRQTLTDKLHQTPYSPRLYLDRAACHQNLLFPDLAAGDAYKALLLTDEAKDVSGEYHEQALQTIEATAHLRLSRGNGLEASGYLATEDEESSDEPTNLLTTEDLIEAYTLESHQILGRSLLKCGCFQSAYDFITRGLRAKPDDSLLKQARSELLEKYLQTRRFQHDEKSLDKSKIDLNDLPDQGSVRRELYPWNHYEPDRFSLASISFLNSEIAAIAPRCSVLSVNLPLLTGNEKSNISSEPAVVRQLGIFAKEDIAPGETVLQEYSLLTANNRLHDPLCDACSSELPGISSTKPIYACDDCEDTVFCSSTCRDAALSMYHLAICGKDVDSIGKDTKSKEAVNALYLLLLGRAMALSETQDIHPLELKETKYIWGDFIHPDSAYLHSPSTTTTARHLPFSFTYNILSPLHLLEKMDINIFTELRRYDIWIFNTLYAKFRGTASARMSVRDGRPEVCAVHPMWCLANHSCAPNVRWEWGGQIQLLSREGDQVVKWGPDKDVADSGRWRGGIQKGEEILNHYCDVDLGVKERREWALGALGGMCVCERCLWEDDKAHK